MELGATVCTPKSPLCISCPLQRMCVAYQQQQQWQQTRQELVKSVATERAKAFFSPAPAAKNGCAALSSEDEQSMCVRPASLHFTLFEPNAGVSRASPANPRQQKFDATLLPAWFCSSQTQARLKMLSSLCFYCRSAARVGCLQVCGSAPPAAQMKQHPKLRLQRNFWPSRGALRPWRQLQQQAVMQHHFSAPISTHCLYPPFAPSVRLLCTCSATYTGVCAFLARKLMCNQQKCCALHPPQQ